MMNVMSKAGNLLELKWNLEFSKRILMIWRFEAVSWLWRNKSSEDTIKVWNLFGNLNGIELISLPKIPRPSFSSVSQLCLPC